MLNMMALSSTDSMIDLLIAYAISSGEVLAAFDLVARVLTSYWQVVSYGKCLIIH